MCFLSNNSQIFDEKHYSTVHSPYDILPQSVAIFHMHMLIVNVGTQ